jgi:uncharacterized protein
MIDLVIVIPAAYVLLCVFLRWREPSMIYFPDRQLESTPDAYGLSYEDVFLTTTDGVRIHGWFLPAPRDLPSSPFTLLFLHGNAGNISHRLDKLAVFHELGASVLIIDYRGYGRSEGKPSEEGTYRDAQAAYEYLTGKTQLREAALPQRGSSPPGAPHLEPRSIVVYGESIGSAVAVDLASKFAVGGVVLEEPFTSIGDVGQEKFPFLPIRLLARTKYDSLSKIGRINAPLLMFHSRDDEYFSIRHAERLLAAAREPKRFVELHGSHNDAFSVSADTCRAALKEFLGGLGGA